MSDTVVKVGCVYFGEYQYKHLGKQKTIYWSERRNYQNFSTYFVSYPLIISILSMFYNICNMVVHIYDLYVNKYIYWKYIFQNLVLKRCMIKNI